MHSYGTFWSVGLLFLRFDLRDASLPLDRSCFQNLNLQPPISDDSSLIYRALLWMAQSFNRVGNAPRFVLQISNLKYEISNRTIAARWARG